jgi:hypothetical protein
MTTVGSLDGASLAIRLAAIEEDHDSSEIAAGKNMVKIDTNEHSFRRKQELEAREQARESEEDSSFWGDVAGIAKDVAVVGAVAGAAFTGGSTLIVAASLVGGACTVGSDVAKRVGADEGWVTGLAIAGAGCSLVAGGAAIFSGVGPVTTETSAAVRLVGDGVGAGGSLVGAGAGYLAGRAKANEADLDADATAASGAADNAQSKIDESISDMRQAFRDRNLKMETAANLQRSDEQLNDQLLNNMRG